jgi:hypothetical protein
VFRVARSEESKESEQRRPVSCFFQQIPKKQKTLIRQPPVLRLFCLVKAQIVGEALFDLDAKGDI